MSGQEHATSLQGLAMPDWLRERLARHAVVLPAQLCDLLESWLAAEDLPADINRDEIREVHQHLLREHPALAARKRSAFVMPPPGIAEGEPPEPEESDPGRIEIQELMGSETGSLPEPKEPEGPQESEEVQSDSGERDPEEKPSTDAHDQKPTSEDNGRSEQDNHGDRSKGEG